MTTLCYIDTETTGLDPRIHQPYEVSWWLDTMEEPSTRWLTHDLRGADASALQIGRYFERSVRGYPTTGDLTPWADHGVLLLNRSLTVRPGAPASHRGRGWEEVTDAAIRALVARRPPKVTYLPYGETLGSGDLTVRTLVSAPSPVTAARWKTVLPVRSSVWQLAPKLNR